MPVKVTDHQTSETLPHPTWSGSFRLFGVDVYCQVLSDGQRIIEAGSLHRLLEAMGDGPVIDHGEVEEFAKWQRG